MAIIKEKLEMRGMSREELVNYFSSISRKNHNNCLFYGEGWKVKVTNQKITMICSLKIPSTVVEFYIQEEVFDDFLKAFRLKFLSAGG
ncbi:hypothetical protein PRVXT_000383 [Proteinivorax tanatarense]|uniref:Molybdopterin cofactor biosynthesis MoaD-related C-terminal domain-containing protein n=1 Tax=Proteinivorax tanatarense TaxID=1260629 RepID=A0AAU7VMB6_9FIRM